MSGQGATDRGRGGWLAGRFEKLERIGEGGMAEIRLAKDHGPEPFTADRRVALKMLKPIVAEDRAAVARFEREGKEMSGFEHENIAEVFQPMRDGAVRFLVMEYISGCSLAELLRDRGAPVPPEDAVEIISQACAGVGYAHARGIVHRDIKPANVMLDGGYAEGRRPHVKLTDFGIAGVLEGTRITRTGGFVGTPAYMALELLRGHAATFRSDVYACGVLLYQLLTGRLPFDDEGGWSEIAARQEAGPPMPPAALNPMVPEALSEAVLVALRREPGARYESVAKFSGAVEAAWEGEDFHRFLPKQRTLLTLFLPRTRRESPRPEYAGARPWLALILFFGTIGALLVILEIVLRLSSAIAELPIWMIATPVAVCALAVALARSPLFAADEATRAAARFRLRRVARSTGRTLVVCALAGYWALLGYHLTSTVRNAIDRQPQGSHLWLEIGSAAIWIAVALFPLKWLLRSRMRVSRLVVVGAILVVGWTVGSEAFPEAPGAVAPLIWGHPSLRERVTAEGKRWMAMLSRPDPRAGPVHRSALRSRLRRSRNAVLRALGHPHGGEGRRLAGRRARRWLRSMRRARVAWRRPRCRRDGSHLSIERGGGWAIC